MTASVASSRVAVDTTRCQGYGLCVGIHPEIFDVPAGSAVAVLLRDVLDEDDLADVEEAVRACPAQAISIVAAQQQAPT